MLGADARIIKARRDRMRLANLSEFILQQISFVAVQNADTARGDRGRMMRSADAEAGSLDADHPHSRILEERIEKSDRIRAAIDACDQHVRQPPFMLENLATRLAADHCLEVAHDHGIRMRSRRRTYQVVSVA